MNNHLHNRHIRIFISSTFKDMMAERDYLIKVVYPALREEAKIHKVSISLIDLRWGITEEESHSGLVIERCLCEIDDSRPFLIGLVGDRYGWIPKKKDIANYEELVFRFPMMEDYIKMGISVTEMEMRYAILDNNEKGAENNAIFLIKHTKQETNDPNLGGLQERIRKSSSVIFQYDKIEEIGNFVLNQFKNYLDANFPVSKASPFHRLKERMDFILNDNAKRFVGDISGIVGDFQQPKSRLCIETSKGNGKTAILAKIASEIDKNENILVYYTNKETISSRYFDAMIDYLIWRLGGELKDCIDPFETLNYAIKHHDEGKLYFILDGICNLDGMENYKLLKLIKIIGNAHMILSLDSESEYKQTIQDINFSFVKYQFDNSCRKKVIASYLKSYGKSLMPAHLDTIARMKSSSMADLHTGLEMLITNASFDSIYDDITSIFQMTSEDKFIFSFNEMKHTFGENLVEKFFGILACCCLGIEEMELMTLLGISPIQWSLLFNSARPYLVVVEGAVNISQDFMKLVFDNISPLSVLNAQDILIPYFKTKDTPKAYLSLAALYDNSMEYDKLFELLQNYSNFKQMYEENEDLLADIWKGLLKENNPKHNLSVYCNYVFYDNSGKPNNVDFSPLIHFILRHFPDDASYAELVKMREMCENFDGVQMAVLFKKHHEYCVSPRFYNSIACNCSNISEKILEYKKAVAKYENINLIFQEERVDVFSAYCNLIDLSCKLHLWRSVQDYIIKADQILNRELNNDPKYSQKLMSVSLEFLLNTGKGNEVLDIYDTLQQSDLNNNELFHFYLEINRFAAYISLPIQSQEVAESISDHIYDFVLHTFGRKSKQYETWLKLEILRLALSQSYTKGVQRLSEFISITGRLFTFHDLSLAGLNNERDKIFYELYSFACGTEDLAAIDWYAKYVDAKHPSYFETYDIYEKKKFQIQDLIETKKNDKLLCRLIFSEANDFIEDDFFELIITENKLNEHAFFKAYNSFRTVCTNLDVEKLPNSAMGIIRELGLTAFLDKVRNNMILVWRELKVKYPSELSDKSIINDNDILDAAESNYLLGSILIPFVKLMIEMEGFVLDYADVVLAIQRENLIQDIRLIQEIKLKS